MTAFGLREGRLGILAVALVMVIGCASAERRSLGTALDPIGPGAIFPTVDAAAIDGLKYAHLMSLQNRWEQVDRGGVVYRVDGGFTHGGLTVASKQTPGTIELVLQPNAVARFRTYSAVGHGNVDRGNESISRSDRRSVDKRDPLHRPMYILTPSLKIRVYRGTGDARLTTIAYLKRGVSREPDVTILAGTSELYF